MSATGRDDVALEEFLPAARAGDAGALDRIVRALQGPVYRLALHMLWHPEDARDAAQEILIRLVTGLAGFRGESAFTTWAYRVAANHLLATRRSHLEAQQISFDQFAADLEHGLEPAAERRDDPEAIALLGEVKVGCTLAMLSCLDRPQRLAYTLGEIMEFTDRESAEVLEISEGAFRKRLSRARRTVSEFMLGHCGLVNAMQRCRCHRRVDRALSSGRVDPARLQFVPSLAQARRFPEVLREIRALEESRRASALLRSHGHGTADLAQRLRTLLSARP